MLTHDPTLRENVVKIRTRKTPIACTFHTVTVHTVTAHWGTSGMLYLQKSLESPLNWAWFKRLFLLISQLPLDALFLVITLSFKIKVAVSSFYAPLVYLSFPIYLNRFHIDENSTCKSISSVHEKSDVQ